MISIKNQVAKAKSKQLEKLFFYFLSNYSRIKSSSEQQHRSLAKRSSQEDQYPAWSMVVMILILVALIHTSVIIYYQYSYDFSQLKLENIKKHLMSNNQINNTTSSDTHDMLYTLDELVKYYESRLDHLGYPRFRVKFASETIYLINLISLAVIYLAGLIIFNNGHSFDAFLIDLLFGSKREEKFVNQLVERLSKLYRFSGDSTEPQMLSYRPTRRKIAYTRASKWPLEDSGSQADLRHLPSLSSKLVWSFIDDKSMLPNNFRYSWKQKQLSLLRYLNFFNLYYFISLDITIDGALLIILDYERYHLTWRKIIFIFETTLIVFSNNAACFFHVSIQVFSCIDQVKSSRKMRRRFIDCIRLNTRLFQMIRNDPIKMSTFNEISSSPFQANRLSSTMTSIQTIKAQMNANLMVALIHYQVLLIQAQRLKLCLKFILFALTTMEFIIPIIIYYHIPLFDPEIDRNIRWAMMVTGICIAVPTDLCMVPMCMMHSNFLKLYKTIYLLLAHSAQIHLDANCSIYDSNLIAMLIKELDRPQGVVNQYGESFSITHFNYSDLVKINFYFGFLVIIIIVESQAKGNNSGRAELFGNMFSMF